MEFPCQGEARKAMGRCPHHIFCLVRRNVMNGSESLPNVSIMLQCRCFGSPGMTGRMVLKLYNDVEKQTLPGGPSWCRSSLSPSGHRQKHMH